MRLYHGTNATLIDIVDNAKVSKCINGIGFYMTDSLEVARKYGSRVVELELEDFDDYLVRPIDQRYTDGLATYEECVKGGMEYVITNQNSLNNMILDCVVDANEVH